MSLINEALKKAQKQQLDAAAKENGSAAPTGNPPPPPPAPPAAPAAAAPEPDPIFSARRQRKSGGRGKWAVLAVVLVVIGVAGYNLTPTDSADPVQMAQSEEDEPALQGSTLAETAASPELPAPLAVAVVEPVEQLPNAGPVEPTPIVSLPPSLVVTPVPEPEVEEETPVFVAEATSNPAPREAAATVKEPAHVAPEPVRVAQTPSTPARAPAEISSVPAVVAPKSTPSPSAPLPSAQTAVPRPVGKVVIETIEAPSASNVTESTGQDAPASEAVLNYLEKARVTGIRVSATDPKVLMNNRVYRLNEVVDRDLQLRIVHIAPRELRFQDPEGHVYRKTF